MPRIDTHQHLIDPDHLRYEWTAGLPALANKSFTLDGYREATSGCDIAGAVFVEVDVPAELSAKESELFCKLAEDPQNKILGVVASGRPEHDGFAAYMDSIRHPKLVGLRRVLHTQSDDVSQGALFRRNVGWLGKQNLTFDICVNARKLHIATALVDACPNTRFILDHCGVPDVAARALDPWRDDLRELSKRPNVACKISGIIAYADAADVSTTALRPFVEHAVECFGWDRVMFGGDWPVCNLTAELGTWVSILDEILQHESPANREKFDHLNATAIYGVQLP